MKVFFLLEHLLQVLLNAKFKLLQCRHTPGLLLSGLLTWLRISQPALRETFPCLTILGSRLPDEVTGFAEMGSLKNPSQLSCFSADEILTINRQKEGRVEKVCGFCDLHLLHTDLKEKLRFLHFKQFQSPSTRLFDLKNCIDLTCY